MGWVWWFTPIIPATWAAQVERLKSQNDTGKKIRPSLKNNLKYDVLVGW
jgi:hypothetical protein